jgi:hypothetical protein
LQKAELARLFDGHIRQLSMTISLPSTAIFAAFVLRGSLVFSLVRHIKLGHIAVDLETAESPGLAADIESLFKALIHPHPIMK